MRRIGVLGGTFDPPHIGHLLMALYAYSELKLDEVLFLPTGTVPHKDNDEILPVDDRLEMLRLVIERIPYFGLCTLETELNRTGYTYETLGKLSVMYPQDQLFFIVGADSLCYMDRWKEPQLIFDRAVIAAVWRAGISFEEFEAKRAELTERFGAEIQVLTMPMIEISSTEIRRRVMRGEPIDFMTDPVITAYIKEKKLYR